MEDSHTHILSLPDDDGTTFFGVYDGHGGSKISQHVGKHLHKYIIQREEYRRGEIEEAIRMGFLEMDEVMATDEALKEDSSGTTAVIVLVKNGQLYCGNVGDSRAVASVHGISEDLSLDHKPTGEREHSRITRAGGYVEYSRVNGNLALSRALGDYGYKTNTKLQPEEQVVTANPDVEVRKLSNEYEFILIACDGIWDVLTSQDAVDFVRARIAKGMEPEEICEALLDHCLAPDLSFGGLGCDNMTAILAVFLNGRTYDELVAKCRDSMISSTTNVSASTGSISGLSNPAQQQATNPGASAAAAASSVLAAKGLSTGQKAEGAERELEDESRLESGADEAAKKGESDQEI